MDDLIVTGSSSDVIEVFKAEMKRKFDMSNLGSLSSYLGIEVKQGRNFIFPSQVLYAQKLLNHEKLTECNATTTPVETREKFTNGEGGTRVNSIEYRRLIGSLRYLTHTRPDLLFSMGILSRYMENQNQEHYNGVKRVLGYVKGTEDYGLFYKKGESNPELIGYNDSDFAGDCSGRKITSGHIFFFGRMTVS